MPKKPCEPQDVCLLEDSESLLQAPALSQAGTVARLACDGSARGVAVRNGVRIMCREECHCDVGRPSMRKMLSMSQRGFNKFFCSYPNNECFLHVFHLMTSPSNGEVLFNHRLVNNGKFKTSGA